MLARLLGFTLGNRGGLVPKIDTMGGFRGVLGVSENPWGYPRFFPSFYSLQNDCGHMFTQCMWLSAIKLSNGS